MKFPRINSRKYANVCKTRRYTRNCEIRTKTQNRSLHFHIGNDQVELCNTKDNKELDGREGMWPEEYMGHQDQCALVGVGVCVRETRSTLGTPGMQMAPQTFALLCGPKIDPSNAPDLSERSHDNMPPFCVTL